MLVTYGYDDDDARRPTTTMTTTNIRSMLGLRRRRRANINPTLALDDNGDDDDDGDDDGDDGDNDDDDDDDDDDGDDGDDYDDGDDEQGMFVSVQFPKKAAKETDSQNEIHIPNVDESAMITILSNIANIISLI